MHGYVPYHTKEYLARQALNRKERVVQGAGKAVSNENHCQQILPRASSSVPPPAPKLPEVAYHDDFWIGSQPVRRVEHPVVAEGMEPLPSWDFPLSLPFETWPGYDTANALQNFPSVTQSPPSITPLDFTIDYYTDLLGTQPQLYTTQSQDQEFGGISWPPVSDTPLTEYHGMPPFNGDGLWDGQWPLQ